MRVLMTGGGTAGHVNPAIAIANTIREKEPDAEIAFVCSTQARDKAGDLVPRAGYEKLYRVDICGSFPIWNPKNIITLIKMIRSRGEARKIIEEYKPDVIIGTGGYACYPVLNAGAEMGIPTIVHESNAIAGKAVLRLAHKVDCVMTNFESTLSELKRAKRAIRVGNPIIASKGAAAVADNGKFKRSVLAFGGSLGAENVNLAVADMIEKIADKYPDTEFYLASGKRDFEHMKEEFARRGLDKKENATLVDYIYDMDKRMARADLVICRAGAMTVSELALGGKAAIIIPSPYVAANHQYKNAKALEDRGACVLVQEGELESGRLAGEAEKLLLDEGARASLSKNVKAFAMPDANETIYNEIKKIIEQKKD